MNLTHPISGPVAIVPTIEEFLALFDESVREAILQKVAREDVAGVVSYEGIDLSMPNLGHRTAMIFGPGCTYKTAEECAAGRLGDVPSRFQYPRHIYIKKGQDDDETGD